MNGTEGNLTKSHLCAERGSLEFSGSTVTRDPAQCQTGAVTLMAISSHSW